MGESTRWQRALVLPLTILAWAGVIVVLGWLLSHVIQALLILVIGIVIAFAVTPLVRLLARRMPRTLAIAISYVVGFIVVFGLIGLVVASAVMQIASLVHNLPSYNDAIQGLQPMLLRLLAPLGIDAHALSTYRSQALTSLQSVGASTITNVLGALQGIVTGIVDAVLVLILSIYLTANGPKLARWINRQVPLGGQPQARELLEIVNRVVGGYVRGTLTMATLVGLLVGGGMAVLGVHYPLLLGVVAFLMEFIPILGVFISGALCVTIALFQGWVLALVVVVYFAFVHVIEGDVVGPRVMGQAVGVHPAVSLMALVAATEVFGFWGALFGAPLAGLIQAVVASIWKATRPGGPGPPALAEAAPGPRPARGPVTPPEQ
jgi:predicted PurR-regulated permease PerM